MQALNVFECEGSGFEGYVAEEEKVEDRVGDAAVEITVALGTKVIQRIDFQSNFLEDLAPQAFFGGFADLDEPTWQRQFSPGRILGTPDKQDLALRLHQENTCRHG